MMKGLKQSERPGNIPILNKVRTASEAGGDIALLSGTAVAANSNLLDLGPALVTDNITKVAQTGLDYTLHPLINGISHLVDKALKENIPPLEISEYMVSPLKELGALITGYMANPEVLSDIVLLTELGIIYTLLKSLAKTLKVTGAQRSRVDHITGAITKGLAATVLGAETVQYIVGNGNDPIAYLPLPVGLTRSTELLSTEAGSKALWATITGIGAAVTGLLSYLDTKKASKKEA